MHQWADFILTFDRIRDSNYDYIPFPNKPSLDTFTSQLSRVALPKKIINPSECKTVYDIIRHLKFHQDEFFKLPKLPGEACWKLAKDDMEPWSKSGRFGSDEISDRMLLYCHGDFDFNRHSPISTGLTGMLTRVSKTGSRTDWRKHTLPEKVDPNKIHLATPNKKYTDLKAYEKKIAKLLYG